MDTLLWYRLRRALWEDHLECVHLRSCFAQRYAEIYATVAGRHSLRWLLEQAIYCESKLGSVKRHDCLECTQARAEQIYGGHFLLPCLTLATGMCGRCGGCAGAGPCF